MSPLLPLVNFRLIFKFVRKALPRLDFSRFLESGLCSSLWARNAGSFPEQRLVMELSRDLAFVFFKKRRNVTAYNDPITRYGINYAGTQIAQWDFKTKESRAGLVRVLCVPA